MTGPVVAVLDPAFPFSLAACVACTDPDHAAQVVTDMRRQWPNGVVTVLYPEPVR